MRIGFNLWNYRSEALDQMVDIEGHQDVYPDSDDPWGEFAVDTIYLGNVPVCDPVTCELVKDELAHDDVAMAFIAARCKREVCGAF